jgi:hypothetical protein
VAYTGILHKVRGIEKMSKQFVTDLLAMCFRIKLDPTAVASVIAFESNFSPSVKNPYSGATGLIQFMPKTATRLGTTTNELARMSAEQQLLYVERYLVGAGSSRVKDTADVYMCVFWPAAIGKPLSYVLTQRPDKAYTQNKALDQTGDGTITKGEAARFVLGIYDKAVAAGELARGPDPSKPPPPPGGEPTAETDPYGDVPTKVGLLAFGGILGTLCVRTWKLLSSGRRKANV